MKARDRLVVAALVAIVLVGAMWLGVVAPERSKASALVTQISSEQVALTQAQAGLNSSREAVAAYVGNVHQIDAVVRSVPRSPAEAALIKTIVKLAGTKVDFRQLGVGSPGPTAAGPVSLGLSFNFNANYGNLQSFLAAIDALTTTDGTNLNSDGRLFTIQTVSLQPIPQDSLRATIVASVYQQNPAAGVTGATGAVGATP